MRITKIYYTPTFQKNLRKISPQDLEEVGQRERLFRENPFDPKLKTHKLKGKLSRYWSFSISYSQRILLRFLNKIEVLFVDIGGHEIYR